jgi:hypothetical protein
MLDMRISGHVIKNIPVAISTCPINTLLLGRAKIFEMLDICFLHKAQEYCLCFMIFLFIKENIIYKYVIAVAAYRATCFNTDYDFLA